MTPQEAASLAFETQVVHAGIAPEPRTGAVMTPIYQTSTYAQRSPGEHTGYEYSRTDNPTRTVLQEQLAVLEKAKGALVFSSGLAAVDAVLNLLRQGDHVLAGDDLYGGTYRLFTQVAGQRGIEFSFVSPTDPDAFAAGFRPNTCLVWLESPTNPMLTVYDLPALCAVARDRGVLTAVDNTFMSPYFQNPLELGADLVMHSLTKYVNGHSDVVMGALMARDEEWLDRLKYRQNAIGATPGPQDCFLVLRGVKTLALRMQRHADSAQKVAEFLESHPRVARVLYPGLPSHPQHELAKAQMRGFGGMITAILDRDLVGTVRFLEQVRLFTLAESLGGVESLIEHPAIMTHASLPSEVRYAAGISDALVRLSVGIEDPGDLIRDLDQALA